MSVEYARSSRFDRLTSVDLMFLRLETEAWPCHFGGLAVLEGKALLDTSGQLRLGEIRDHMNRRMARVPDLRRRVHLPGFLRGRPLWVDDDHFDIAHHVHQTAIQPPGGDVELLEAAAEVYGSLLDRGRPLWELWFLTGATDGRVGVLLKLHHSMADGLAAVRIVGSLFDLEPDAPEPMSARWSAEPAPRSWPLFVDNFSVKIRAVGLALAGLANHPLQSANRARTFARMTRRYFAKSAAPPSSLNQPVQEGRRVRFLPLDLAAMKEAAHAQEGKINDVVLALWAGGLRNLLMSRGESVAGVELITGMAVSLRSATETGTIDNRVGTVVLPLPVWEAEIQRRLDLIVSRTRKTKAEQTPAAIMGYLAGLAATPIGRYYSAHQHASNVIATNVIGPPIPVYMLGARILEILPIIELVGNIGLTLCAFSYTGQIFLVVTADARAFPDLEVLMAGMEQDWQTLIGVHGTPLVEGEMPRVGATTQVGAERPLSPPPAPV